MGFVKLQIVCWQKKVVYINYSRGNVISHKRSRQPNQLPPLPRPVQTQHLPTRPTLEKEMPKEVKLALMKVNIYGRKANVG